MTYPNHRGSSCLFSTVQNTSGYSKVFGFLPPHGVRLGAGQEFSMWGDVREAIIRGERSGSIRSMQAFEKAVSRGDITILHTPNPILEDVNYPYDVQMVVIHGGSLALFNPCWESQASVDDPDVR